MTRVLVTDAGRGSAISIIRSLGRRGIEVVAADANRRSPGFYSRHAADRVLYPPPRSEGPAAVEALVRSAGEKRVDLVIPVGEEMVVLLSRARDRFGSGTTLALPEEDALETARDKLATVELATRVGVPAPRTILARTASEALREAGRLRWPVVLKPQTSRSVLERGRLEAFGVSYATDRAGLAAQMAALEGRSAVLLQEYRAGEGHGVGLLMERGRPLLAFQHRRLREVPFTGGPSSLRESVRLDPVLFDYSVRLLEALEWTGPAMVEFKVGRDGASLMEVNGRLWGSLPLAVKSGVDFPGRLVELFLSPRGDAPRGAELDYALGVRSRDLALELTWIASVLTRRSTYPFLPAPRRREAAVATLQLLDPRHGFDVLSARDPAPGVVEVGNIVAKAGRHAARALRPFVPAALARAETRASSR